MRRLYEALFTISASSGEDSNAGCYFDRPPGLGISNLDYYTTKDPGNCHLEAHKALKAMRHGALHVRHGRCKREH